MNAAESDAGFAPMNIEAGQTSGDSRSVSRPFQMERTWINDLHRQETATARHLCTDGQAHLSW